MKEQDVVNYFLSLSYQDKLSLLEKLAEYTESELVKSD